MKNKCLMRYTILSMLTFLWCNVSAQELTPRAYWPTPKGTNVLVVSYQNTTGDIVTDPSLPIVGVDSDIDYLQITYQRTISLAGRTAAIQFSLPYSQGTTVGMLEGEAVNRTTTGLGDTRVRLAYNIVGAPSMNVEEFKALRAAPHPIIGTSLLIQAPTGEYDTDELINIGTNRWSIKPAIGVIWPLHPTWLLEAEIGTWFFGDNDEFVGQTREQDPILSTEVHLVKRIRPGFWASLDANYYAGGRTRIGDSAQSNLQRNSRAGATVVVPLKGKSAIRASFSTGVVTESGGDFDMFNVSYLYAW